MPSHYYSSPKNIRALNGNRSRAKHSNWSYNQSSKFYTGKSRKIVKSIEYNQRMDWRTVGKSGNIERSSFGKGMSGTSPANIQKNAFKSPGSTKFGRIKNNPIAMPTLATRNSKIEGDPFKGSISLGNKGNIEGNPFNGGGEQNGKTNIEGNPFHGGGEQNGKTNIEGNPFQGDDNQTPKADIEADPFKVSWSAQRRSNEIHRAIRYKQQKQKKNKISQYGLFEPDVEGWETRAAEKPTEYKKKKEGKGTKNPDGNLIK